MMKEKELQILIKESVNSPTGNFTDKVMHEINAQGAIAKNYKWKFIFIFASCIAIFILSFLITFPELEYLNYTIRISPIMLPVLSVGFILYEVYQLLEIGHNLHKFKDEQIVQL